MEDIMLSKILVSLLQGVVLREDDINKWNNITIKRFAIQEYVGKIGFTLIFDDLEGFCYLKQDSDDSEIPKLVARHQLSYYASLILVVLRKKMQELDMKNTETRLIISKNDLFAELKLFIKDTSDETRQKRLIDNGLSSIEKLGFIRYLKSDSENFEVLRIIRSFVDGNLLSDIEHKLSEYKTYNP